MELTSVSLLWEVTSINTNTGWKGWGGGGTIQFVKKRLGRKKVEGVNMSFTNK